MSSTNFGALTDHFGYASADLILVESSAVPVARSVERAEDDAGDYADIHTHGQNAAGDLKDATNVYELQSGTLVIDTLDIGESAAGAIASNMSWATSNGGWPRMTITGQINTETVVAPTALLLNTWSIPDAITLTGQKKAQVFDFAVDAGTRLTDSTYEAGVEITPTTNGLGIVVAHGVSGGQLTQGGTVTRITAAPAWSPTAGWEEVQIPGEEEPQAGYHTASFSAEKNMDRDAAP